MGYMLHHAIIVHSFDDEMIETAHAMATKLDMRPSPISKPDENNGETGFYIPPDGSKEDWEPSDQGDKDRDTFVKWLCKQAHDDGSNNLNWIEVAFGGGEPQENTRVVRAGGWDVEAGR
jgi:hypothetical protein